MQGRNWEGQSSGVAASKCTSNDICLYALDSFLLFKYDSKKLAYTPLMVAN